MQNAGYIRDPHSPQDWIYGSVAEIPSNLPKRLSYESKLGPSFDQGNTFECVCYSIAGLKRLHEWNESKKWLDFDPHELYQRCKAADGYPAANGTLPRVAMDLLRTEGMLASDGNRYTVSATARISSIDEIKAALASQGPVLIGLRIDPASFSAMASTGDLVANYPDHFSGHCMLIVGYDDELGAFRIRNSWGDSWGDNGHLWLAYDYLKTVDPSFDAWSTVDAA